MRHRSRGNTVQIRNVGLLTNLIGPGDEKLMSARALAKTTGISHTTICNLMNGTAGQLDQAAAIRLAKALNVPIWRLFFPPPCPECGRTLPEEFDGLAS